MYSGSVLLLSSLLSSSHLHPYPVRHADICWDPDRSGMWHAVNHGFSTPSEFGGIREGEPVDQDTDV